MLTSTLAAVWAIAAAGCQLQASFDGQFACTEPPYQCPDGYTCRGGQCLDRVGQPPPAGTPDAAVGSAAADARPDDASEGDVDAENQPDADLEADASTPPTTFSVTFGEGTGATVTDVTTDTHLSEANPDLNRGGNNIVGIDADPRVSGLLQFDLSSLAPTTHCVQADLTISVNDPIETGDYQIFPVSEAWVEGEATWNNRSNGVPWSSPGAGPLSHGPTTLAVTAPRVVGGITVALDAALVEQWIRNPSSNHGMVWISTSPDGRGGEFRSSENSDNSLRPLLRLVLSP